MPLYEYTCHDCSQEVEILVRHAEDKPECPECGSNNLAKLLSVPAAPGTGGRIEMGPLDRPCGSGCECFPDA